MVSSAAVGSATDHRHKSEPSNRRPVLDAYKAETPAHGSANPSEVGGTSWMADASPSSRFDLCESCQAGDSERVKVLLSEKSADPNEANDSGMTPLLYATEGDHVCCIAVLLADPRIDPSRTGGLPRAGGLSALMVAADVKAARAMGLLLADPRTDVNQGDERNGTALAHATFYNFATGVNLLLQHRHIRPNLTFDGSTALCVAAIRNYPDVLRLLLADERVEIGSALLHAACGMQTAVGRVSAEGGENTGHCFVLILASRRVDPVRLAADLATMQTWMPNKRELRMADTIPLTPLHETARLLVPILYAETIGERRWCAQCHKITPDENLDLCGGCGQVGYCTHPDAYVLKHMHHPRRDALFARPCHVLHWKAGHKVECARFQLEAKERERIATTHVVRAGKGQNKNKPRGGRGRKQGRRR